MNNEIIVRDFMLRIWNEKDFDSIPEFVHPEYTVHLDSGDPWEMKTLNHEQFKVRLTYSFNSFPDISFEIQSAIPDGDYVAITWMMTGTNLGNIGEIAATNRCIKTLGSTIYHLTNGKVSGHYQVFDRTKVMRQLGF